MLKVFVSAGVIVFSTVAGGIWAVLTNNSSNASELGSVAGFLVGGILVMTTWLARTK